MAPLLRGAVAPRSGVVTSAQPSALRRGTASHARMQRGTPATGGTIFTVPSPHPAAVPASTHAAQSAQQRVRGARGGFMSPAGTYYAFEGERARGSALSFGGEQSAKGTPGAGSAAATPGVPGTQLQAPVATPGAVDQTVVLFQGFGGLPDPLRCAEAYCYVQIVPPCSRCL